jgi:FdrA protein
MEDKKENLPQEQVKVINIGLELFAEALREQGVEVAHLAWQPPARGDAELISILDALL